MDNVSPENLNPSQDSHFIATFGRKFILIFSFPSPLQVSHLPSPELKEKYEAFHPFSFALFVSEKIFLTESQIFK